MPNVQAMQRRGLTFTRYYVTDSLCCPSRSSIFTGKLPHDTGVFTNKPPDGGYEIFNARGNQKATFATALQSRGYMTGMMGKYLNGYSARSTRGSATGPVPPGWSEWDVADDGYPEFNYDLNENGNVVHYGSAPSDYLTDVVAEKGVSFVEHAARAGKPFALEIATFAPHDPYTPAPRDAAKFPGLKAPRGPAFDQANVNPPAWLGARPPLRPAQISTIDTAFRKRAQAVQAVDLMIGRLEAAVTRLGLADNTYIVFSSDNGYHMGEHRLAPGKQTAFETDIRVPLVVVGPDVPAGRRTTRLASNIDLAPTFEQLGGASIAPTVDGRSLVPLLHGQQLGPWRHDVLVEHHGPALSTSDPDFQRRPSGDPTSYEAIRTDKALYVEYMNGDREYYDLSQDPYAESLNGYGTLDGAQRARLHAALAALQNCHGGSSCWAAATGSLAADALTTR